MKAVLKLLSDELDMNIPYPHEFTNYLSDLIDNVESTSFLNELSGQFMASRDR